jgi:hypothetical protein
MNRSPTRRTVAKLLLAAPAAAAVAPLACQTAGPSSAAPRLTPEQKQQQQEIAKTVSRLDKSLERLKAMEIPVGSEPAIHFSPLLARK